MPRPVLIFVPGAWHSPACYNTIIKSLTTVYSYKCIALPLQAVAHQPAVKDLEPDITALRTAVLREIDAGDEVVVVGHSWGGVIVSAALNGLGKNERAKKGKTGGVVRLVYLCAFVPLENTGVGQITREVPEWFDLKSPFAAPPPDPKTVFYNDLPPAEAEYWESQLKPHSSAAMLSPVTAVAWKEIPCSYLICEGDNAVPAVLQEAMVKACQDAGAEMEVERWKGCGHSPFLSRPDEVVTWLRKVAGEGVWGRDELWNEKAIIV